MQNQKKRKSPAGKKPDRKGGLFPGGKRKVPATAQQTLPYREMYRDGVCRVDDHY